MELQHYLSQYHANLKRKHEEQKQIWETIPVNLTPIESLKRYCQECNFNFIDPDFPPIETSLYPEELVEVGGPFDTPLQWRRPKDFIQSENIGVFLQQPSPLDIKEGSLGNSWFLSALAALAQYPSIVEKLFVIKDFNEEGIYRVNICKNGEWQIVTIDDYFPCYYNGGPIFSSCNESNSLWVLILEKVYAKLHGNYLSLRGGFQSEALQDLTGNPTVVYDLENKNVHEYYIKGDMWKLLQFFKKEDYIISVTTAGEEDEVPGTLQYLQDQSQQRSLLKAHSYPIQNVIDIDGKQLVCISNPWGKINWNGKWSSNSKLWTNDFKNIIQPNFNDDSTIWLSLDELVTNFKTISVCRINNWEEVRLKGKFLRVEDQDNNNNQIVLSRWHYKVGLNQKSHLFIGIHQEDERCESAGELRPYLDIGITVLKQVDDQLLLIQFRDFIESRQCELDLILEEGTYIILPKTTGCTMRAPQPKDKNAALNFINQKTQEFNREIVSTLKDIFSKFDLLSMEQWYYSQFEEFFACLGFKITQDEFQEEILSRYCSTDKGLTFQGFKQFIHSSYILYGEDKLIEWLKKLGYKIVDGQIFCERSRCFNFTIHSDKKIQTRINDSLRNNIDFWTNNAIIKKFGREIYKSGHLKLYSVYSENIAGYSFLATYFEDEQQIQPSDQVEIMLDLTAYKQVLITNTNDLFLSKKLSKGETQFMFHARVIDPDFKLPLKPNINFKKINNESETSSQQ